MSPTVLRWSISAEDRPYTYVQGARILWFTQPRSRRTAAVEQRHPHKVTLEAKRPLSSLQSRNGWPESLGEMPTLLCSDTKQIELVSCQGSLSRRVLSIRDESMMPLLPITIYNIPFVPPTCSFSGIHPAHPEYLKDESRIGNHVVGIGTSKGPISPLLPDHQEPPTQLDQRLLQVFHHTRHWKSRWRYVCNLHGRTMQADIRQVSPTLTTSPTIRWKPLSHYPIDGNPRRMIRSIPLVAALRRSPVSAIQAHPEYWFPTIRRLQTYSARSI